MADELYRFDGQKLDKINLAGKQYSYSVSINDEGYLVLETDNPKINEDSIYINEDGQLIFDIPIL